MKLLNRFFFICCIYFVTVFTGSLHSLEAGETVDWQIIQQVDDLFLPNELNESLDKASNHILTHI